MDLFFLSVSVLASWRNILRATPLGLCPWTPLGDFRPPDPLRVPLPNQNPGSAPGRLSVCLSVTRRHCIETAEHIKLFPPSGSDTIAVFPYQTLCQFRWGHPSVSNAGEVGKH